MKREYAFHPIANLFPLLEGGESAALVKDIAQHGLHEAIVIYEDQILDGRNRYRACSKLVLSSASAKCCLTAMPTP